MECVQTNERPLLRARPEAEDLNSEGRFLHSFISQLRTEAVKENLTV